MLYILLNILFASSFVLVIKWVQIRQREDILVVGAINYITAALLSLPALLMMKSEVDSPAAASGLVLGVCYFVAYFFVIHSVRLVGAASTTVVSSLSIMVPIVVAALIWSERPSIVQAFGIGFAILSLMLIGYRKGESTEQKKDWRIPTLLASFFALAGVSRLSQDAFHHVSHEDQRPTFLFAAFAIAALPSLVILWTRKRWPSLMEWVFGAAIGIANILQTHFMIRALDQIEGFVVFPITSAGGLIVTTIVAQRLLSERIEPKTLLGILLAVVALVCLN